MDAKLREFEGKQLFQAAGIPVPLSELIFPETSSSTLPYPLILKSQVRASDRKAKGGIVAVENAEQFKKTVQKLFQTHIDGELPEVLLAEVVVPYEKELYVSFSYSSTYRAPALALSGKGGSGIAAAALTELNPLVPFDALLAEKALENAGIASRQTLVEVIVKLGNLFFNEKLLLAEINPLFVTASGEIVAGDAKMVRDSALIPSERPFVDLGGDIAVIASGGGASMLAIDLLINAGGAPANYVEYSGNPKSEVVKNLTTAVLSRSSLKGAWIVGGTANFTDIFETLAGFVEGLRALPAKPTYPIVIRRDGPRAAEARKMLEQIAQEEGYELYVCGPEVSIAESAALLVSRIKS